MIVVETSSSLWPSVPSNESKEEVELVVAFMYDICSSPPHFNLLASRSRIRIIKYLI